MSYTFVEATCDKASGVLETCTVCGIESFDEFTEDDTTGLYVPALGHTEEVIPAVAATCSATGLTAGKKCTTCGEILVKQEEVKINPNNHTKKLVEVLKAPGCTTNGVGKYACKDCDKDMGYYSMEPEHAWTLTKTTTAATCSKEGKGTYTCSVCKVTKTDVIPTTPHTFAQVTVAECGKNEILVEKCTVCKAYGEVIEEGALVEHNWGENQLFEATCTTEEYVGKVCSNPDCPVKIQKIEVTGAALGHDYTETLVDATCEKANGIYHVCNRPGCTQKPFTTYFTTADGALYEAALGHEEVEIKAVASTCSAKGLTAGKKCTVCGKVTVKQTEVAKNPDAHTKTLVEVLKANTCTTNGVGKYACKDCGKEMGYYPIAAEHTWEVTATTAPTCGKDGKGNKVCTVCGEEVKNVVIEATGKHDYKETVIDATCTAPAKFGKVCTVCGAEKDLEIVEGSKKLGHKLVDSYLEPTCTKGSGILTKCERCDYNVPTYFEETDPLYVKPLGHKETAIKAVTATCSTEGFSAGKKCSRCGEITSKPVSQGKNPEKHTSKLVDTLKAATCTTNGVGKYACKDCGKDLGYGAISNTHTSGTSLKEVVTKAATCAKAGKAYKYCTNCTYKTAEYEKAATGKHTYVAKAIDATCTEGAKYGEFCTVCNAENPKAPSVDVAGSEALGHKLTETYVEASCEYANGILSTCDRCDYEKLDEFAETDELYEAKKGHKEEILPSVAGTCAAPALSEGVKCSVCDKVLVAQVKGDKVPTNHTKALVETLKAATCKTTGVGKYACKDCKTDLGYNVIPAAHQFVLVVTTAATCGKDGVGENVCMASGCNVVEKNVVIPATGKHTFVNDYVLDATCTNPAYAGTICSGCGAIKDAVAVGEPEGHSFKETSLEATCDRPAGVLRVCTVCDAEEFVAYEGELAAPALTHKYETVVVAGTCKTAGYTADVCTVCGDKQNVVAGTTDANNHTAKAGNVIKPATCKTSGIAKSVCAECNKDLGYVAITAKHTYGEAVANESGTIVYVECTECATIKVVTYFGTKQEAAKVEGKEYDSLEDFEKTEK